MASLEIKKVFVSGLKGIIDIHELTSFFQTIGEINALKPKYKAKGSSLCIGYAILEAPLETCNLLIGQEVFNFENRQLRCTPYLKGGALKEYISSLNSRRLILDGILESTSKEDLKVYFQKFGPLENVYIIDGFGTNRETGKGFLIFKESSSAKIVNTLRNHNINGALIISEYFRDSTGVVSPNMNGDKNVDSETKNMSSTIAQKTRERKNTGEIEINNKELRMVEQSILREQFRPTQKGYWTVNSEDYLRNHDLLNLRQQRTVRNWIF